MSKRTHLTPEVLELPQHLRDVASEEPALIDRAAGAALVSRHVYPTTKRTVESWDLPWKYPNGRAIAPPETYLAYAYKKSCEATRFSGRRARRRKENATA
jgi:hypothetical protein